LFCEVDLAIMPSRTEGFGLTALEALSAGLPVLVSGNSGLGLALKEVVSGSQCVVDSEDPKEWAKKIKAVREKSREVRLAESKLLRDKYLEKFRRQESCGLLLEKMQNLVFGKINFLSILLTCIFRISAIITMKSKLNYYYVIIKLLNYHLLLDSSDTNVVC